MLLESLVGAAGGGLLRLAPEVLKLLDRRNERVHELALGEQQRKLVELQGHNQLALADRQADTSQLVSALEALREGIKAQAIQTGNVLVDAVSATVRPVVTYLVAGMWATVKVAGFCAVLDAGAAWYTAAQQVWGPNDVAMLTGILNFWFLGRVFDKRG